MSLVLWGLFLLYLCDRIGVEVSLTGSKDNFIRLDLKKTIIIWCCRGLPHPD